MKNNLFDMNLERIKDSSLKMRDEFKETTDLGERFEADKIKIEQRIMEIQESNLAYEDKQEMIVGLEEELNRLREQYTSEVEKKNNNLVQYFESEIKIVQEKIESLKESLLSIKEMKVEAADFDRDRASEPIRDKKAEFESIKSESKETLESIIQTTEEQKHRIRKNNYQ